jgi:hypothetical protein
MTNIIFVVIGTCLFLVTMEAQLVKHFADSWQFSYTDTLELLS